MEKIKSFQITDMTFSGFKCYAQPTEAEFGPVTTVTGGNGRGKSSVADAIAFAVTGLPFFGERGIDRLHSEDNSDLFLSMRFTDGQGREHELTRSRKKSTMSITYDGVAIRQADLTELFGEKDLFLSIFNPLYRCNLCGAKGNSVTLYARLRRMSNGEAYRELAGGSNVYLLPSRPVPQNTERQPAALYERDRVYREMLSHLTLNDTHRQNLRERGLSDQRIEENGYKSMPATERARKLLAELIQTDHELLGIPGFYTQRNQWTVGGPKGFLIPVRDRDGFIQGLKIRLDEGNRKYRWFSTRHEENGTRSYSWIHVTGDRTKKRAFLTEGSLKGDVASFLAHDALFVCTGGVNAVRGLRETVQSLGVTEVVEAMDMDQFTNPQVMRGILAMRKEVMGIPGLRYSKYTWNPAFKGVDDYLLSRTASM